MTQYPDIFAALAAPFAPHEVKVRHQAGRQLHYITARTAMNRLDSVLGPENWWDEYKAGEHSVECLLTIRLPDGSTLTKADAGGYAGMADQGDDDKSGYSDGFKRACVKFGVGRYLYRDGVPEFVGERLGSDFADPDGVSQPNISGRDADHRPAPARQDRPQQATRKGPPPSSSSSGSAAASGAGVVQSPPRSGRALFAWVKDQEQRHEVGLLQYMNKWGKLQDLPGRMVDWDGDAVAEAYKEAIRKLQESRPNRDEAFEEALGT